MLKLNYINQEMLIFLVATDAIGMGINMDLENVYFSNLKKFDGKKLRRLNYV